MCGFEDNYASKNLAEVFDVASPSEGRYFLGPGKYGFRKGCGTHHATAALKVMCERSLENNNKVHVCYVDFESAFDRINWVKLMAILADNGVDRTVRNFIKELYINQKAFVMVTETVSEACSIGRGVRQGCSLSQLLLLFMTRLCSQKSATKGEGSQYEICRS